MPNHTPMLESLESRALFSVATAAFAVQSDVTALRSVLTAAAPAFKADTAALTADVAALPKSPANRRLVAALKRDSGRTTGRATAAGHKLAALAAAKQSALIAAATTVALNPSDGKATAKLSNLITRTQAAAAGPIAKLRAVLTTATAALVADAAALVAANPSAPTLAADAAKAGSDFTSVGASAQSSLTRTETDVAALVALLKA